MFEITEKKFFHAQDECWLDWLSICQMWLEIVFLMIESAQNDVWDFKFSSMQIKLAIT